MDRTARHRFYPVVLIAMGLVAASCTTSVSTPTTVVVAPMTTISTSSTTQALAEGEFIGADGVSTIIVDTSRIVSLTGDITEVIFELGLGDRVVAVDITTTYPPEANDIKRAGGNVGFAQALAAEAVLKFEPTLVIGDESVQPSETIEQLRSAGISVVILKYHTTLTGVTTKIRQIAQILDVEEAGEALATRVASEIAAAQARAALASEQPRIAYLYTRGPTVILLFGRGIPTQAMLEGAGGIDVGAELGEGAFPVTPEALIVGAPDVIVVPQSGIDAIGGFDALLEIPGVADTPAGRNRRFLAYDEAYFFNLGPRAGVALAEFVDDLYPDLSG